MSEFEDFISSQGFGGDFQRGCNGQYKSDLLHFMEKAFMHQQAKIDELQRKIAFQEKAIKNIKLQFENKQIDCDRSDRKIDELQARVDEALRHVVDHGGYDDLTHVINILKGNKDEN